MRPIERALRVLARDLRNGSYKNVVENGANDIAKGDKLVAALVAALEKYSEHISGLSAESRAELREVLQKVKERR